jgi:hypothetical protein
LMNKNIIYNARLLLAVLLILTIQPGQISALCPISCEGGCRLVSHERRDIFVEFISNQEKCCSNQSGQPAPCCKVKQDIPEDGRFLPTTFRVSSPDFYQMGIIAVDNGSLIDQPGFHPKEHFVLTLPRSTPLYLQNLSILC